MSIHMIILLTISTMYIGSVIGVVIKLANLKAKIGVFSIALFLPFLSFIFMFCLSFNPKRVHKESLFRRVISFIWFQYKTLPFMTGIFCVIVAKDNIGILDILIIICTKGIGYFYKRLKSQFLYIEKNIVNNKKTGIQCIMN